MHDALEVTDELARGWGGVGGRVTGRGYAPACAGLEAQDSYELRVTLRGVNAWSRNGSTVRWHTSLNVSERPWRTI